MDSTDEIVELVKDLEAALAIVRTNAAKSLNLTLLKAEVEIGLTATTAAKAGFKFELGVTVDTSAEREWSDVHTLGLVLEPKQGTGKLGATETEALAAGILELAALHKRIADLKSTEFVPGQLKVGVSFERSTSGKLQVVVGPGKSSKSARKVTLSFRPS